MRGIIHILLEFFKEAEKSFVNQKKKDSLVLLIGIAKAKAKMILLITI